MRLAWSHWWCTGDCCHTHKVTGWGHYSCDSHNMLLTHTKHTSHIIWQQNNFLDAASFRNSNKGCFRLTSPSQMLVLGRLCTCSSSPEVQFHQSAFKQGILSRLLTSHCMYYHTGLWQRGQFVGQFLHSFWTLQWKLVVERDFPLGFGLVYLFVCLIVKRFCLKSQNRSTCREWSVT